MDSEVCAYFKSVVPDFDAEAQLANFEMKEDVAEWLFRNTRQEAISAAVAIGMSERAIADGHHSIPHKGITATFVFGQDAQDSPASSGLPAPVDISGLLPPPHPSPGGSSTGTIRYRPAPLDTIEEEPAKIEDSPTGNITPPPSNTIKDKAAKTEVSAQALARWIEGLEEQLKPERQSKTKKRNTQRRKAKAKANEAATVEGVAGNSESK